jgi:hypothetical protein
MARNDRENSYNSSTQLDMRTASMPKIPRHIGRGTERYLDLVERGYRQITAPRWRNMNATRA